jgi:uncharacterized protein (TIGR03435 family)
MAKLTYYLVFLIAGVTVLQAQSSVSSRPKFAVVSIKANTADCCTGSGIGRGGSHGTHVTLQAMIGLAYKAQSFEITGGAGWMRSDRFDFECKADDPTVDNSQLRLMLQAMLEDRFGLKLHRETRESAIYALVVSKGGAKIRPSSDQTSPDDVSPTRPGDGPNHGGLLLGTGLLVGNGIPLSRLATVISPQLERMVVDRTNLTGRFDIQLRWTPDPGELSLDNGGKSVPVPNISDAPPFFTAIQEQLGLRLQSTRGPAEVIVIDGGHRPSEN